MPDVSERTLQLSVVLAFASGVLVGWQANRLRRRYLDWRKRRLQDKLAMTQKKLDLAAAAPARPPRFAARGLGGSGAGGLSPAHLTPPAAPSSPWSVGMSW
ncbi:hypothetical protein MC885_000139 [Smutsia gigantea]|nr:hypothetical protein MC885_000139 [Smutsia gigantea]